MLGLIYCIGCGLSYLLVRKQIRPNMSYNESLGVFISIISSWVFLAIVMAIGVVHAYYYYKNKYK